MSSGNEHCAHLFDLDRFQSPQYLKLLLYFPIGILLLVFRLVVYCFYFIFSVVLPKSSKLRCFLMKGFCVLFGVFVKQDVSQRSEGVKLLICNHISIIDHLVIDSVLNCRQVDNCPHFSEWNMLSILYFPGASSQTEIQNYAISQLKTYIDSSDTPVMLFPEGAMTNGKYGLLKFTVWPFALSLPVQPVIIEVSSIPLINISPSVLGTSIWYDLLWLLFVPCTVFSLRLLPPLIKKEKESVEEFSNRTQTFMATFLHLMPTNCTLKDKDEYEKHLMALPNSAGNMAHSPLEETREPNESMLETNRMALQVKEILPNVPLTVIQRDIGVTKSVHDTIVRIMEGVVKYIPDSNITACDSKEDNLPSLNTAVNKFGKTSKDRMMSYQERKAALIMAAKIRYMKRHSLM